MAIDEHESSSSSSLIISYRETTAEFPRRRVSNRNFSPFADCRENTGRGQNRFSWNAINLDLGSSLDDLNNSFEGPVVTVDSFVAEVDAIVGDFSTRRIEIPTSARCNRIFAETSPSGVDFPIINLTAENCFATLRCRERERFVLFHDPPTNNPGINSHPIVSLPSFRLDILSLFRVTQPSKEKSQLTPKTHGNAA